MKSKDFTCNDITIRINSEISEIIDYLNYMFGNYYTNESNKSNIIDYVINFRQGIPDMINIKIKKKMI